MFDQIFDTIRPSFFDQGFRSPNSVQIWGQFQIKNFQRFSPIFGEKMAFFLKANDPILAKR
jgi:hypothetical protein